MSKEIIMNKLTHDLAAWLKISLQLAVQVQAEMGAAGVDFSGSSNGTLKREAKLALAIVTKVTKV